MDKTKLHLVAHFRYAYTTINSFVQRYIYISSFFAIVNCLIIRTLDTSDGNLTMMYRIMKM